MTTKRVVADGTTLDDIERYHHRLAELTRRIKEGTLALPWVNDQLQLVVEGKSLSPEGLSAIPAKPKGILEPVSTFEQPAIGEFVAREHFVHGEGPNGLRLYLYDSFKRFLDKVESPTAARTARIHRLRKDANDQKILAELGGEAIAESTLGQQFALLTAQPNGVEGLLLTNGYANIFYIRDGQGTLWAVGAFWSADDREWGLYASSVASPYPWRRGSQVLSC